MQIIKPCQHGLAALKTHIVYKKLLQLLLLPLLAIPAFETGAFAQAPVLQYSDMPNRLSINKPVTIAPTISISVATAGYGTSAFNIGSGFNTPLGLATDASGNIYVADYGNHSIKRILSNGAEITIIGTGFSNPDAVAVDMAGNVYVADGGNNAVKKIQVADGTTVTLATGFNNPSSVAVDVAGNLYVTDQGNHLVKKIVAGTNVVTTIGTGFTTPTGVTVDAAGNVFVCDYDNRAIYKIAAATGLTTTVCTTTGRPQGITTDVAGNLYFIEVGNGAIKKVPAGESTSITIFQATGFYRGIGVTKTGRIYYSNAANNTVNFINPAGGYFLDTALPAGLSFNSDTGVISGTPTTYTDQKTYFVTAWNGYASKTAHVYIEVKPYPIISYNTPLVFKSKEAIAPIGPAIANEGSVTTGIWAKDYSLAYNTPRGVAVDEAGNIYTVETGTNTIKKSVADGSPSVSIGTGLVSPLAIAADKAGNLFVTDVSLNVLYKIKVADGKTEIIAAGFNNPSGVAVDTSGNVYVADRGNRVVKKITAGNGNIITIGAGFVDPTGVGVDDAGNVYVCDYYLNTFYKIDAVTGSTAYGAPITKPLAIAVDALGNVYVASNGTLKKFYADLRPTIDIFNEPNFYRGIAVDGLGQVYFTTNNNSNVTKLKPSYGYNINKALPKGLYFNELNGVITGTPQDFNYLTNYTITNWNANGYGSAKLAIKVEGKPTVNYNTPPAYDLNTTITNLTPRATAVGTWGVFAEPENVVTGVGELTSIAIDAADNIYVADKADGTIKKFFADDNNPVIIGSGFGSPQALAINSSGSVFVADGTSQSVYEINALTGLTTVKATGFNNPVALTVDHEGTLYVADHGIRQVRMIRENGSVGNITVWGVSEAGSIAVSQAGDLYVVDTRNQSTFIYYRDMGWFEVEVGDYLPLGVAFDGANFWYQLNTAAPPVIKIVMDPSPVSIPLAPHTNPKGMVLGKNGVIYYADGNSVKKITPLGGYYIDTFLPAGLNFDRYNGTISGTPKAAAGLKSYKVTAWNEFGSTTETVNIKVNGPPSIVYANTTRTYMPGVEIAPLVPTIKGMGFGSYSGAVSLGSSFSNPGGPAVDTAGNVYVADRDNRAVKKIPAGGGAIVKVGTGLSLPKALAVDATGDIYVADEGNNQVLKILAATGVTQIIATGFNKPTAITIDGAGNIYVTDQGNHQVKMIPADGGAMVTIGSGFSVPNGVAVDEAGNVYVTDYDKNAVYKIDAVTHATTLVARYTQPTCITIDGQNNLYVGDYTGRGVAKIINGVVTPSIFEVPGAVRGITIDQYGRLYYTGATTVSRVSPAGGLYINKTLPVGLFFNNSTGVISGKPSTPAVKKFVVTAWNNSGSASANLTITVLGTPTLKYNPSQIFSINTPIAPFKPTSANVAALTYQNGKIDTLATGSYEVEMVLDTAENIYIVAFEAPGYAVKKIPRGGGAPINLIKIRTFPTLTYSAHGGIIITDYYDGQIYKHDPIADTTGKVGPSFPPNIVSRAAADKAGNIYYTSNGYKQIRKIPADGGPIVTLGRVFNNPLSIDIDAADNIYVCDVADQNVYRIAAADGSITSIMDAYKSVYNKIATDASLNVYVGDYSKLMMVPKGTGTPVKVWDTNLRAAVSSDGGLCFMYNGNVIKLRPAGAYHINKPLPAGLNFDNNTGIITGTPTVSAPATTYKVTAYNNIFSTSSTFTLGVTSPDAGLSSLAVNRGTLSPVFDKESLSYKVVLPASTSAITITPVAVSTSAIIKVNADTVASGNGINVNLVPGLNTITVKVKTVSEERIYTVKVYCNNSNALLSALILNPDIPKAKVTGSNYRDYTATVLNNVSSIRVTATVQDPLATVKVNGVDVLPGVASAPIPLNVGTNTINTVVTAHDGTTTLTYSVVITRQPPVDDDATLSAFVLYPNITKAKVVGANYRDYTATVANNINVIKITAVSTSLSATLKINGVDVASGVSSAPIPLNIGTNTINTVVTAGDGRTTKTYSIVITRQPSTNGKLKTLTINENATVIKNSAYAYTTSVDAAITQIRVKPLAEESSVIVLVNNIAVERGAYSGLISLNEGTTAIDIKVTATDGTVLQSYTLSVLRNGSNNANLKSLKLNPNVTITETSATSYTATVASSTETVMIRPITENAGAGILVNNLPVASGTYSLPVNVSYGANTIIIQVTAQDGTQKTYKLTITREISLGRTVNSVNSTIPADTDVFVPTALSPNGDGFNDILQITGIENYPQNRLQIMNSKGTLVYDISGYDNNTKVFDGRNKNGTLLPAGTYFYMLRYTDGTADRTRSGYVVIKY